MREGWSAYFVLDCLQYLIRCYGKHFRRIRAAANVIAALVIGRLSGMILYYGAPRQGTIPGGISSTE